MPYQGVVTSLAPLSKSTEAELSKKQLPNTYVPPLERVHLSTDMVALDLEDVLKNCLWPMMGCSSTTTTSIGRLNW